MVRVSSPAKLRPWSELTAKMVMGVVPGLVIFSDFKMHFWGFGVSGLCRGPGRLQNNGL